MNLFSTRFKKSRAAQLRAGVHTLKNSKLACAFRSWKRWIPVHKEQIQLLNVMIVKMQKHTLAAGFHGWLAGAFYSREMRVKCEMVVTLIMNHTLAGTALFGALLLLLLKLLPTESKQTLLSKEGH